MVSKLKYKVKARLSAVLEAGVFDFRYAKAGNDGCMRSGFLAP